ncbi:hypothetical protein DNH61_07680 [Paenibacillus sambharensis]|uniref:Uncharacterized protein n=1 Tax=Paenibacillus sambharensis TaxID=1803190 RepID=A0A2W1LPD0_9BACL|nr:hypothetical protein [Paenibacillus sambharensis]PZD96384.1 hypothetical protein DNH61_07680 [Paenibacillus sambharensis]
MNIEIDDNNIDVKKIMKQIKENLNKRSYEDDLVKTSSYHTNNRGINLSALEEYQLLLNRTWNNSTAFPITSHRRGIGTIIVFVKKVIRKSISWYMNPIMQRQTEFNANVVRAYNEIVTQLKIMEEVSAKQNKEQNDKRAGNSEVNS